MSQVTAVQLFYRVADRNKVAKFPKKHLFRSPFYAKSSLKQVSSKHFQKPFLTALGKCFHYLETFENCNKFPISNRLTIDRIIRLSKPPTLYRIKDLLVILKKVFVAIILGKGTFSSISDSYGSKYWRKYCLSRPYHFKFLRGCLPQILLSPFLNTLTHIVVFLQLIFIFFEDNCFITINPFLVTSVVFL